MSWLNIANKIHCDCAIERSASRNLNQYQATLKGGRHGKIFFIKYIHVCIHYIIKSMYYTLNNFYKHDLVGK